MATIDKDLLLDKIDRLLKLHSYAREDWFANTIHNTVWDAPEIETGGETIYRADAIKAVIDAYVMDAIYEVISEDIIKALSALPSAEAVQGEWIIHGEPPWVVRECSQCGTKWHHWSGASNPNYCGHCGARMKGGDDE